MKVLFTSKSGAGAWQIRGMQIAGASLNWIASNNPTFNEIENSEIICVVKKIDRKILNECKKKNKLIVLDVVDLWPQSRSSKERLSRRMSISLIVDLIKEINPHALIFPNFAMWADLRKSFPALPSTFIYHHYRPEFKFAALDSAPSRVASIGYEGADYLGEWTAIVSDVCKKAGIDFVINPKSLLDVDVVLSARGTDFRTFLNCNYKSNVKATNAIGAMKPFLCHVEERSAHEVDPGTFLFFDSPRTLALQIDRILTDEDFRVTNLDVMRCTRQIYEIESVVSQFDLFFTRVLDWYQ